MTIEQKQRVFNLCASPSVARCLLLYDRELSRIGSAHSLLKCGFKEIEAGFPSASETEFAWIRGLIEKNHCPDDVWLQVRQFPLLTLNVC
jgi:hypothetical protein